MTASSPKVKIYGLDQIVFFIFNCINFFFFCWGYWTIVDAAFIYNCQ